MSGCLASGGKIVPGMTLPENLGGFAVSIVLGTAAPALVVFSPEHKDLRS
jgi:hypothetical protein